MTKAQSTVILQIQKQQQLQRNKTNCHQSKVKILKQTTVENKIKKMNKKGKILAARSHAPRVNLRVL